MKNIDPSRRSFLKTTALTATAMTFKPFYILNAKPKSNGEIIGHGTHKYKVQLGWGNLDSSKFPINNCHEMVQDLSLIHI